MSHGGDSKANRPPYYKAIGISLAIGSGLFIGTSFVLKKVGLLRANAKYNEEAGEGYGYLKNAYWWSGMTLMILGEILNVVAYAFTDAILVTPLGALSVVITTILSAIFLKEKLSFVGKVACFLSILGSIIIVVNAPEQSSVTNIQEMQHFFISPGFLSYAGVIIVGSVIVAFWVAPRWGKKSMLVYLSICSLIGGLSVISIQGIGAAVTAQARGEQQFNQWFLYVLLVFVICTLVTEIIYLNKALNLFNAAIVTPTYYVYFTSATIVSSAVLFQGFKGTVTQILTIVMGFLVICAGVVLLQLAKSSKDVPETTVFTGDFNDVRTIAEQEQPESEPKADTLRGTSALIRRISLSRQKMEEMEAKRIREDRLKDATEVLKENEQVEWDGLRRRKTIRLEPGELQRRNSLHPPLGMSKFPEFVDDEEGQSRLPISPNFLKSFQRRPSTSRHGGSFTHPETPIREEDEGQEGAGGNSVEMEHVMGLPTGLAKKNDGKPITWASDHAGKDDLTTPTPRSGNKRQFSFQNMFNRGENSPSILPWGANRTPSKERMPTRLDGVTEEERLGLVIGDSNSHRGDSEDEKGGSSSRSKDIPKSILKNAGIASRSDAAVNTVGTYPTLTTQYSSSSPDLNTPGGGRPLPNTPQTHDVPILPHPLRQQVPGPRRGSPARGPGSRSQTPPRNMTAGAAPNLPPGSAPRSRSGSPPKILINDEPRQGSVDQGGQGPGGSRMV